MTQNRKNYNNRQWHQKMKVALVFLALLIGAGTAQLTAQNAHINFFSDPAMEWARYARIRSGKNIPTTIRNLTQAELRFYGIQTPSKNFALDNSSLHFFRPTLSVNPYILGWHGLTTTPNDTDDPELFPTNRSPRRTDSFYLDAFRLPDPILAFGLSFASEHLFATSQIDFNTDTIASKENRTGTSGLSAIWTPLDFLSYMNFPEQAYMAWTGEQSAVIAGRLEAGVGLGDANLLLNGQARWYDQIQYSWWSDKFRFFSFLGTSATHLSEEEHAVQTTRTPPGQTSAEPVTPGWDQASNHDYASGAQVPVKLFTVHRVEFKPFNRFGFGVSELQLVGGKVPDLSNLLPVVYWHNTYSAGVSNVSAHIDAWGVPVDGLLLRGEFLMDDTKSAKEEDAASKPNSWAWQLGATWVIPASIRDWTLALEGEYSHVDEWTYNRWQPWLIMYQRQLTAGGWYGYDASLGHPAGGDLDEGRLRIIALSKGGARFEIGYSLTLKGPVYLGQIVKGEINDEELPGTKKPVYIPVYFDFDNYTEYTGLTLADLRSQPDKYQHGISVSGEMPLRNRLTAQAGAEIRYTVNDDHVKGKTSLESVWRISCRWSL